MQRRIDRRGAGRYAFSMEPRAHPALPWRLLLLAAGLVAVILAPFLVWGAAIERWTERVVAAGADHPAATAAVFGGLLAGDIVLPTPSSLVSTACGRCLGFARGTLVSFAGMGVSAVLGYGIGFSAAGFAARRLRADERRTLLRLHSRWGVWMLAALRPVPVLAEAAVLFAGLSRLPWKGALAPVLAANLAVSAVYAAIGAFARGPPATLLAFAGAALLSGLVLLGFRRRVEPEA